MTLFRVFGEWGDTLCDGFPTRMDAQEWARENVPAWQDFDIDSYWTGSR